MNGVETLIFCSIDTHDKAARRMCKFNEVNGRGRRDINLFL